MKGKIEIVSVIELNGGIASEPQSFIIQNEINRTKIVETAEKLFVECAKKHGMEDDEIEEALDSGNYDNHGNYEVILTWSTVMN